MLRRPVNREMPLLVDAIAVSDRMNRDHALDLACAVDCVSRNPDGDRVSSVLNSGGLDGAERCELHDYVVLLLRQSSAQFVSLFICIARQRRQSWLAQHNPDFNVCISGQR